MSNKIHRVTEVRDNLSDFKTAEESVENCLTGNRASSFAWYVEVVDDE